MCYDPKDRPPNPPGPAGTAHGEDLVLTAEDSNRFAAYAAHPDSPKGAQVLIFPDVRGLHGFYKELALRFAEQGIEALAMDYFGRTAGLTPRDDSFEFWPHVQQMQMTAFFADVKAAVAHMAKGKGKGGQLFTLGFCMGGSLSLVTGTQDFGQTGVIAFYAGLSRMHVGGGSTVLEQGRSIRYPVLGMFGGADQGIPVEQVQDLDNQLTEAGVEHEIVVYPGAPHSFFDRKAHEYADASADAWNRVLGFIAAHSP